MSNIVLSLENISKSFISGDETINVLSNLNLEILKGKKVAVIGQSGAGKSTLLQIAGLLEKPTSGEIILGKVNPLVMGDGKRSKLRGEYIGFVYQSHHLLREFTAIENVMMPALIAGTKNSKERAEYLLKTVGLSHRHRHFPTQLSGGEQQRVAIARALMNNPKLLLADEPTGNLDSSTADEVGNLFNKLVNDEGMALLMVTHNHEMASSCDEIYELTNGILNKLPALKGI